MAISSRKSIRSRIRKRVSNFSLNSIVSALTSISRRPISFLFLILTISLAVSEITTFRSNKYKISDKSILGSFYNKFKDDSNLGTIASFINSHRNNTIGFISHLTAITASTSPANLLIYGASSSLFCYLIPESNIFEYFIQAALFILFFRLKSPTARLFTIAIGVILYFGGYLFSF